MKYFLKFIVLGFAGLACFSLSACKGDSGSQVYINKGGFVATEKKYEGDAEVSAMLKLEITRDRRSEYEIGKVGAVSGGVLRITAFPDLEDDKLLARGERGKTETLKTTRIDFTVDGDPLKLQKLLPSNPKSFKEIENIAEVEFIYANSSGEYDGYQCGRGWNFFAVNGMAGDKRKLASLKEAYKEGFVWYCVK